MRELRIFVVPKERRNYDSRRWFIESASYSNKLVIFVGWLKFEYYRQRG